MKMTTRANPLTDAIRSTSSDACSTLPLAVLQDFAPFPPGDCSLGGSVGATLQDHLAPPLDHRGLLHGPPGEVRWGG